MKPLSIEAWLAATHRPACLDVRKEDAFVRAHLPGAGHVPLAELEDRIHELPSKGTEVFVVGGPEAREAAFLLDPKGRWQVAWSEEPCESWPVEMLVAGSPERLWRPNIWLEEHWQSIPSGGRVLDVAMGTGRNAVFLAMQGFSVEGIDILPEAVRFAERLAARHRVKIETRVADLREEGVLAPAAYRGIIVFNFLERALLPRLEAALAPGGVLLYETFTEEQARRVGRPKQPQWLLKPMELYESFSGLEILAYREGRSRDDRYVASLLARKRGETGR